MSAAWLVLTAFAYPLLWVAVLAHKYSSHYLRKRAAYQSPELIRVWALPYDMAVQHFAFMNELSLSLGGWSEGDLFDYLSSLPCPLILGPDHRVKFFEVPEEHKRAVEAVLSMDGRPGAGKLQLIALNRTTNKFVEQPQLYEVALEFWSMVTDFRKFFMTSAWLFVCLFVTLTVGAIVHGTLTVPCYVTAWFWGVLPASFLPTGLRSWLEWAGANLVRFCLPLISAATSLILVGMAALGKLALDGVMSAINTWILRLAPRSPEPTAHHLTDFSSSSRLSRDPAALRRALEVANGSILHTSSSQPNLSSSTVRHRISNGVELQPSGTQRQSSAPDIRPSLSVPAPPIGEDSAAANPAPFSAPATPGGVAPLSRGSARRWGLFGLTRSVTTGARTSLATMSVARDFMRPHTSSGVRTAASAASAQLPPLARASAGPSLGRPSTNGFQPRELCVICMDRPVQVGLLHGSDLHLCMCVECARPSPAHSPCPICRKTVERAVKVF